MLTKDDKDWLDNSFGTKKWIRDNFATKYELAEMESRLQDDADKRHRELLDLLMLWPKKQKTVMSSVW